MTIAPSIAWQWAALTDTGRLRANNEDAVSVDTDLGLALLADGMGGYNGGEVASGTAIRVIQDHYARRRSDGEAIPRALQAAVDAANGAIAEQGASDVQLRGMGTTLVLAACHAGSIFVGHIGDSRCYRMRAGVLQLLTRDHSFLQEQLDQGLITAEQAAVSLQRNLVTRALGVESRVELEIHEHLVEAGDLYLLCSDGLSEMASSAEILTVLLQDCDLSEKATLLVATANDNGGRDNISVVLAKANDADTSVRSG